MIPQMEEKFSFLLYDEDETIYGFLRLRKPSELAHRDEITSNSCIVRELHVFGKSIKIGEHEENSIQHSGVR